MAITNRDRVGKAMELLRDGLAPYVEREFKNLYKDRALAEARTVVGADRNTSSKAIAEWDVSALVKLMSDSWQSVFRNTLGYSERSLVSELREWRNKWAHQENFSSDDAERVLDSITRLLTAISAPQADEVGKMKQELRRQVYEEQARSERRRGTASLVEGAFAGGMKPWREVVNPHPDVASGRYQQAEFAADLWQVHIGQGSDEYRKPVEFFRRTYLTESLKHLLVGAAQRLTGQGGDPVVQLQTNFGGGKTHSMLALYHLFSGVAAATLPGVEPMLAEAELQTLPTAKRVVLVGNKLSPGNPITKADGTVVRTLWGELAYQLGGKPAFDRIAADDEHATSPGDRLRELFDAHGPCLILIDEWVAYARQLHDQADLPGGTFETMFSFAQALTESAKLAKNCLLVISLPASDTTGSPHTQSDDVEVGGIRGREALDRLRNVIGRIESSWRPASAEEGFEIVRRRLFDTLSTEGHTQRDVTARAFAELYRHEKAEFPRECSDADYEKRIQAAYPIHPEIFDRLYTDWSTLIKFQRTRGVLRLMAAVIHSLWEKGDKNPLIMPSTVPLDDPRVQFELTRYLSDNWTPIMEKDVDGPSSLPLKIDGEVPNLGKLHAARRVARTIFLGSAPTAAAAHRGLEDRRVRLGCVMPGESPAVFGDALRRLAGQATFLYQDGPRVWYSTQPTVTKLADDKAEQLKRDPDKVAHELERRVRQDLKKQGDFSRIHPFPQSGGADIADDYDSRLVVLDAAHPYSKEADNAAEKLASEILLTRGNAPRKYRNTLVFLAPDKVRLQDLDEAVRRYLAWSSILDETDVLNLDPQQVKQAETQKASAESAVNARIPEAFNMLLVPTQANPQASTIEWQAIRLQGNDALAVRASKKLRNEELLIGTLGATILRKHLDDVPLWRGNSVSIKQLAEDFASYLYLPRLIGPEVLVDAIRNGLSLPNWEAETFAYAESYNAETGKFAGRRAPYSGTVTSDSPSLLVKPAAYRALEIAEAEAAAAAAAVTTDESGSGPEPHTIQVIGIPSGSKVGIPTITPAKPKPLRFHATFDFGDPARVGRDAGKVAEEVIAHLTSLVGADVRITLEIEANVPGGVEDKVVRIVSENCKTLKFSEFGFEDE